MRVSKPRFHHALPHQVSSQRLRIKARATLQVKEEGSGVAFPLAQKFWEGDVTRCLGASTRNKKIMFLSVKVSTEYVCVCVLS